MTIACVAFSFLPLSIRFNLRGKKLFSLLSVDSASGAFATNEEGTVMDAGGKEMIINYYDVIWSM